MKRQERGQALTEFVVSMITLLFALLGILQFALIMNAQTAVNFAAFAAARAGTVSGGSQEQMEEAARIALLPIFPRHGQTITPLGVMKSYLGAKSVQNSFRFADVTRVQGSAPGITMDYEPTQDKAMFTVQVVHQYEMVVPIVNAILHQALKHLGTPDSLLKDATRKKRHGSFPDLFSKHSRNSGWGYRIPLTSYYTMPLHSDL